MGQNDVAQDRNHEWIRTVLQEAIDPHLKTAAKSESCAGDLGGTEDCEKESHCESQKRDGDCVPIRRTLHVVRVPPPEFQTKKREATSLAKLPNEPWLPDFWQESAESVIQDRSVNDPLATSYNRFAFKL